MLCISSWIPLRVLSLGSSVEHIEGICVVWFKSDIAGVFHCGVFLRGWFVGNGLAVCVVVCVG